MCRLPSTGRKGRTCTHLRAVPFLTRPGGRSWRTSGTHVPRWPRWQKRRCPGFRTWSPPGQRRKRQPLSSASARAGFHRGSRSARSSAAVRNRWMRPCAWPGSTMSCVVIQAAGRSSAAISAITALPPAGSPQGITPHGAPDSIPCSSISRRCRRRTVSIVSSAVTMPAAASRLPTALRK